MKNYLFLNKYNCTAGILQSNKTMQEIKTEYEAGEIQSWDTLEQIMAFISKNGYTPIGHDMFYK